jgi:hypothetical protein
MTVHSFKKSLAVSHSYADAPWWGEVYRDAFPGFASMVSIREDGWAQRGGIDRVVTLKSGKTLAIDEKVRDKDWPDILLERWSDEERRKPGWVQKDLACDYIAYAFVPSRTCYLMPFIQLRRAWIQNGREWCERYETKRAENGSYVTASIAVPKPVLFDALGGAMVSTWTASAA